MRSVGVFMKCRYIRNCREWMDSALAGLPSPQYLEQISWIITYCRNVFYTLNKRHIVAHILWINPGVIASARKQCRKWNPIKNIMLV